MGGSSNLNSGVGGAQSHKETRFLYVEEVTWRFIWRYLRFGCWVSQRRPDNFDPLLEDER